MDTVVVRFGEIGPKSSPVRGKMISVLRQRIVDRLKYEGIDFGTVSSKQGRIVVRDVDAEQAVEHISEIPGVASCSPAYITGPDVESIKPEVEKLDVGETFGVDSNRAGNHSFTSQDLNKIIGDFVRINEEAEVDLDSPDTWVRIDVRPDEAFVFSEVYRGPDGFPVGVGGALAALVSGGIDSPVAAYQAMKRGADILPIYFYNKPVAAEDHLLRFESVVRKLERFHPSKKWFYYVIDMEEVNRKLMEIDSGRMVIHRRIMFRTAEKIAEKEGLKGLVTGEALGQKSSQTSQNLETTTRAVEKPVHRPLLTWNKNRIREKARDIGTLEDANISSACSTMAPENPSTKMGVEEVEEVESRIKVDELVETAIEAAEKKYLKPSNHQNS